MTLSERIKHMKHKNQLNAKCYHIRLVLSACLLMCLCSFQIATSPHLIVGFWENNEKNTYPFKYKDDSSCLSQMFFSSDEFTATISLVNKSGETEELSLAYKIYDVNEEFEKPVMVFKNTCDKEFRLVFSVELLSKELLEFKFQKKYSSENMSMSDKIIGFRRTAGPPENMD